MAVRDVAQDRVHLQRFLDDAFDLLKLVVEDHVRWLPRGQRDDYRRLILGTRMSAAVAQAKTELENAAHDDDLRRVGLTGDELDLKLGTFDLAAGRFRRLRVPFGSLVPIVKSLPRKLGSRKVLATGLKATKTVLGSLSFIPGIEFILEGGDVVEAGLENQRPVRRLFDGVAKAGGWIKRRVRRRRESAPA